LIVSGVLDPEDEGSKLLSNIVDSFPIDMIEHAKRLECSSVLL